MEKTVQITQCDICGKKEEHSFCYLTDFGWVKYTYTSSWQEGIHSGEHLNEFIACPKCDQSKKGIRYLFYRYIKGAK